MGDRPSCCDACGGATCPAPATTTTTSSTTPSESSSTTTTSNAPSLVNPCDGLAPCAAGACLVGTLALCPDGTPALWFGTATSGSGAVDFVFTLCASDAFVSGAFLCLPGSVPCLAADSALFGTILVTVDGTTILFDPLVFADGSCTLDALLVGLTMSGDFFCVDPFGFAASAGTWRASRCP